MAFESPHRHRSKIDPRHRSPWLLGAIENLDFTKTGGGEGVEKSGFGERPGNAAAPERRIFLQILGDRLSGDDVGNNGPPTRAQHPEHFFEQLLLISGLNEI